VGRSLAEEGIVDRVARDERSRLLRERLGFCRRSAGMLGLGEQLADSFQERLVLS
jgi:hypothetical protein